MKIRKREVFILDSSAFIAGLEGKLQGEAYTTPEVVGELKTSSLIKAFETVRDAGKLKVLEANRKDFEAVVEAAASTGDLPKLSKADLSLLALAVKLRSGGFKPTLVTGDYSIQNVAEKLGLPYSAFPGGIKQAIQWVIYCPSCGKTYPSNFKIEVCQVCGEKLKRKAKSKRRLRRKPQP
ncbi:MAG: NOB1 family endonuclease [Candidatus Hecatellaceae archaeon]